MLTSCFVPFHFMKKLLLVSASTLLFLTACNTSTTTTDNQLSSSSSSSSAISVMMDESSSMMATSAMSSTLMTTTSSKAMVPSSAPTSSAAASVTSVAAAPHVITMTAENFKFTPSALTFKKGEKAIVRISSLSGIHGFGSSDLGFNARVEPGSTVDVTIPTDKTGTFTFRCTIPCGSGHMNMIGTITIS
jgi:cytochrome c oxidase subunit 2